MISFGDVDIARELGNHEEELSSARKLTVMRRVAGTAGLVCIGLLGGLEHWRQIQEEVALTGSLLIFVAALSLLIESCKRTNQTSPSPRTKRIRKLGNRIWIAPAIAAVIAQTWYGLGTASVAGGDLAPPNGTAWISHLFSAWTYGGTSIGQPSAGQLLLPWAIVLKCFTAIHLPAAFAERAWSTAMFSIAATGMACLLRLLARSELASVAGSLLFCLNPYVMTVVEADPLYLTMLALVPLGLATIVGVAQRSLKVRTGILILGGSAPLVGYLFANPPLVIIFVAAECVALLCCVSVLGRKAAKRALLTTVLGTVLLVGLSLYWLIPSYLQSKGAAIASLSAPSSWTWTETRSTLSNAYWLNTTWAWLPKYFPFAPWFSRFPLAVLRYGPALLAFSTLVWAPVRNPRLARGAALGTLATLSVLVLSTGTRSPGSIAFNVLYRAPFGWLLREPGRFLVFAALGFSVLAAIAIDLFRQMLAARRSSAVVKTWTEPLMVVPLLLCTLGASFPMYSGLLVQSPNPSVYSEARISIPAYWLKIAKLANQHATSRTLVLPLSPYYQVGYRWGYYGTDAFVQNLFANALDPTAQGYFPSQGELQGATQLLSQAILDRRWPLMSDLARALDVGQILVRRDVTSATMEPSGSLVRSLEQSPLVEAATRAGPLTLFSLRASTGSPRLVTVNSQNPDLRMLSLLPSNSVLVSSHGLSGVSSIAEPSVSEWTVSRGRVSAHVPALDGLQYRELLLPADPISLGRSGEAAPSALLTPTSGEVSASVVAPELLPNGTFRDGPWQSTVGDCNKVDPSGAELKAQIVRDSGASALLLAARKDSACEAQNVLGWTPGESVLLQWQARLIAGDSPRVCLWEIGPNVCAPTIVSSGRSGQWTESRTLVTPPQGTRALSVFVYADASGGPTSVEYRDISVRAITDVPVIVGVPTLPTSRPSVVFSTTFTSSWSLPSKTPLVHTAGDGLLNVWIGAAGQGKISGTPRYAYGRAILDGEVAAGVLWIMWGCMVVFALSKSLRLLRALSDQR